MNFQYQYSWILIFKSNLAKFPKTSAKEFLHIFYKMKDAVYIVMENFSYFPPKDSKRAFLHCWELCLQYNRFEILANTSLSEATDAMAWQEGVKEI